MSINWIKGKPEKNGKYLTACLDPDDKNCFIIDTAEFWCGNWNYEQDRTGGEYEVIYYAVLNVPPVLTK